MIDESVLQVDCQGERLLAVLSLPGAPSPIRGAGIVIVVGGPQVRVGSHRQFVHLARSLASRGWPVLRFDARGMGDSSGTLNDFQALSPDIRVAVDALCARTELNQVVIWGLCDGASAALLHADERADRRVRGLCLANPWVRSKDSYARTTLRHYYMRRLLQGDFWRKLLRGRVGAGAFRDLDANVRAAWARPASAAQRAPFHERMLRGLASFQGPVLLLLSGDDYTAREFADRVKAERGWQTALARKAISQVELADADHTYSDPAARKAAELRTVDWLASLAKRT